MADSPAPPRLKSSSGIPVPKLKRQSVAIGASLDIPAVPSSSRPATPVILAPPPASRPNQPVRQQSFLNDGDTEYSLDCNTSEDPVNLKAQIALLQSSLAASHQRILKLTLDLDLNSPSGDLTPGELTPLDAPLNIVHCSGDEDLLDATSVVVIPNNAPRLPHSNSSYDLKSSAATPGKTPDDRKVSNSNGPLGLSRIPQSAVTQALVLHATPTRSPGLASGSPLASSPTPGHLRSSFLGSEPANSPSHQVDGRQSPLRRVSGGGSAASTRVIDSLQTELLNARGHNEKLKQEMRSNQRLIGSMTRQNEDLKETKERMRTECEGLNNVISRKERLLQEVLERARTAESSMAQIMSTRKAVEQATRKSLQEMNVQVTDAHAAQNRAEREANSLKDSLKSLREVWTREVKDVKDAMKQTEEKSKIDIVAAEETHVRLIRLVESQAAERTAIHQLAQESLNHSARTESMFAAEVAELKAQLERSNQNEAEARNRVSEIATELSHLRRLMREPRRASLEDAKRVSFDP